MTHTQKLEVLSIFSLVKKEYRKLCKLKKTLYCQQAENNLILEAESTFVTKFFKSTTANIDMLKWMFLFKTGKKISISSS